MSYSISSPLYKCGYLIKSRGIFKTSRLIRRQWFLMHLAQNICVSIARISRKVGRNIMDNRTFRDTMGKFATGVTVITTKAANEIHGMTANAFMSVSLDPKLITVSIDNKANMLQQIKSSGQFAVSMLGKEQRDISMHFAGQKKRKGGIEFDFTYRVPIIQDALASVICNVYDTYRVGDHTLFIGEVLDVGLRDGNPLTFYQGKYGNYRQIEYSC